jgi:hypothetical protein
VYSTIRFTSTHYFGSGDSSRKYQEEHVKTESRRKKNVLKKSKKDTGQSQAAERIYSSIYG